MNKKNKIKNHEKWRRFGSNNGNNNRFVTEPWIDKNWKLEDWNEKMWKLESQFYIFA